QSGRQNPVIPLMTTSYKETSVAEALLKAGANPRGSTGMPAAECTRQARQSEIGWRTVLDRGRPTVEDFDQVLALLESAENESSGSVLTRMREVLLRNAHSRRPSTKASSRRFPVLSSE